VVVIVLLGLTLVGTVAALTGVSMIDNPVLFDVAVTLGLAAGILFGVLWTRRVRGRPPKSPEEPVPDVLSAATESTDLAVGTDVAVPTNPPPQDDRVTARLRAPGFLAWGRRWFQRLGEIGTISFVTGAAGLLAVAYELFGDFPAYPPSPVQAGATAAACLAGAAIAATVVRYLTDIDPRQLYEARELARGARIVAWILVVAAVSAVLSWFDLRGPVRALHVVVMTINAVVSVGLLTVKPRGEQPVEAFPLDFGVLSLLGSRLNILASILDSAERQLGIDLRSTWALTVVRRSLEPLIIGLAVVGWLSTSLTVVAINEQGLVERLGVPVGGPPLQPGIHVNWPWPVDRVFRIAVQRVQALTVGHEGEEGGGPEDVLWARQHAANEYTLLLGNGRDLITVDAAVQFRIADAPAWHYHSQNPGDALRAIAYRAVMRTTVNRTLADALSENVVTTTARMRTMVQEDADALGLGVVVLGFTVGGMHPPVLVAPAYQGVVSAELGKVTAIVNAQALRNQTVPAAESAVLTSGNAARAQGTTALALAAGEAWSFLTLQAQYRAAPQDYVFRRRLEVLEKNLAGRRFTIVDSRFQRDGGELWLTP
jgi:regulator of protease activity HflC (stomatin/prohibitin superfamily)